MAGKFILTFCGMTRKENRRTVCLSVGNNSLKLSNFKITILKYSKHFCNEISENAAARCVSLTELKADPSGHAV
jgi:hypothetical protein